MGMLSLLTCQQLCVEDSNCAYVDYDPTSGCYHSEYCQHRNSFENSNVPFHSTIQSKEPIIE